MAAATTVVQTAPVGDDRVAAAVTLITARGLTGRRVPGTVHVQTIVPTSRETIIVRSTVVAIAGSTTCATAANLHRWIPMASTVRIMVRMMILVMLIMMMAGTKTGGWATFH